jgi:hypothetical protein
MAQFSTVNRRKKQKKSVTDEVKQSSDRDQNTNQARNHNQAKERMEQGSIQQAEPEAQNLRNEGTNNKKEDLGEGVKGNRSGKFNDLRFNMYEKGPFNNHLKVKRPDTPTVERKKKIKEGQFDIFNVMIKSEISLDNTLGLFGK